MAAPSATWENFTGERAADSIIEPLVDEPVHHPADTSMDAEPDRQSGPAATDLSTMFPETEDMYNLLIRESVDSGDIDRAWRLVREAEKMGSVTVRRTFIRALERQK